MVEQKSRMVTVDELTAGNFRTGMCMDCLAWIQGNSTVWAEHRRVVHADGYVYRPALNRGSL